LTHQPPAAPLNVPDPCITARLLPVALIVVVVDNQGSVRTFNLFPLRKKKDMRGDLFRQQQHCPFAA